MNKTELIRHMANQSGLSQEKAGAALNAFLEGVTETLSNKESVTLVGFGTFSTSERNAREGRNPSTGETIQIAARTVPTFKPGADLRRTVNGEN